MANFQETLQKVYDLAVQYGMKLILTIVVLIVGLLVIKWITRWLVRLMEKKDVNKSLISFLRTLTNILLKVMLVISILGMAGIQIFHTVLLSPDNRKITIPNSPLATGSITNFSAISTCTSMHRPAGPIQSGRYCQRGFYF